MTETVEYKPDLVGINTAGVRWAKDGDSYISEPLSVPSDEWAKLFGMTLGELQVAYYLQGEKIPDDFYHIKFIELHSGNRSTFTGADVINLLQHLPNTNQENLLFYETCQFQIKLERPVIENIIDTGEIPLEFDNVITCKKTSEILNGLKTVTGVEWQIRDSGDMKLYIIDMPIKAENKHGRKALIDLINEVGAELHSDMLDIANEKITDLIVQHDIEINPDIPLYSKDPTYPSIFLGDKSSFATDDETPGYALVVPAAIMEDTRFRRELHHISKNKESDLSKIFKKIAEYHALPVSTFASKLKKQKEEINPDELYNSINTELSNYKPEQKKEMNQIASFNLKVIIDENLSPANKTALCLMVFEKMHSDILKDPDAFKSLVGHIQEINRQFQEMAEMTINKIVIKSKHSELGKKLKELTGNFLKNEFNIKKSRMI